MGPRGRIERRRRRRLLRGAPWRGAALPPEVDAVPTMLGREELQVLYWLARDYVSPRGAVVDAGAFLGGSSAALLAGLRDRPTPWAGPALHSYDRFRVEQYTLASFFSGPGALAVGDSFRTRYDANVAGFGVAHAVHEGDIGAAAWEGPPIEVLFVDVMKDWELVGSVQRAFFPALVPGRSVIVHQDYGYGIAAWIHISVELIWDHVTHLGSLEPLASHLFLLERAVPPEVLDLDLATLPTEEKLRLMQRAVDRWSGSTRGMLETAHAWLLADVERLSDAYELLAHVSSSYTEPGVLACAEVTRDLIAASRER